MSSISSSNAYPPWGYLADDVLQEIFIFSVTGTDEHFGHPVLECRPNRPLSFRSLPQLSISHVCSTWRQVSLLTPSLWNKVDIKYLAGFNTLIATKWLSRARNVPVSIKVDAYAHVTMAEEARRHSLLISFLSPHRIQHLEIESVMHISLPDLPAQSVADLEKLTLEQFDYDRDDIELSNKRYPKLAHLSLGGYCRLSGACGSLLKFDASKSSSTVGEVWSFLSGCPLLEECYILIQPDISGRLPIATNLHLPSLRILQLAFTVHQPEIPFRSIIEPFSLPHLETFDIVDASIHWSTPAFSALARRSNGLPHLKTFALRKFNIVVEGAALLALIPTVTRVSLCSSRDSIGEAIFDDNDLDRLASGILGPRLKELTVGYISNSHHFMDMVESRMENAQKCNDGAPVSFTKVQFNTREHYANISDRLNNMRERGILIDVLDSTISSIP
ncbi:hypothetical protein JOM56_009339 [Amanita muscaria]